MADTIKELLDQTDKYLTEADKNEIQSIIEVSNLAKSKLDNCEQDCDDAYEIANAACLLLVNPVKVAICQVAAKKARDFCKDKC